jgi:RNA ligase (TIGR02306 family)
MTETYVRKMASIQEVNGVYPIDGADKICQYGINGWRVVDQVGKYKVGDLVVFCEVDSFIPSTIAPFLTKPGHFPKVYNGVEGEKLRTIRLRKQLSQGLLLPLSVIPENDWDWDDPIGTDVSELLGIQKWEAPPEFTSADARGNFPSFIIKTDQERVQNCYDDVAKYFETETWSMEEKADGSSHTTYFYNGEFGVCSRNLNLKESEDNTFWKVAIEYGLKDSLTKLNKNIAIQSELCGPGIQNNCYNLTKYMLFTFDIFDIDNQRYLSPKERKVYIELLNLSAAPVLSSDFSLKNFQLKDILFLAEGKSVLGMIDTFREGLVFKLNSDTRVTFKSISNSYLLKHDR